jgi:hypothetical protein
MHVLVKVLALSLIWDPRPSPTSALWPILWGYMTGAGIRRAALPSTDTVDALARPAADEIEQVDAWWRADNYLTVGQIYLQAGLPLPPRHGVVNNATRTTRGASELKQGCEDKLAERATYVVEHLEDMLIKRDHQRANTRDTTGRRREHFQERRLIVNLTRKVPFAGWRDRRPRFAA